MIQAEMQSRYCAHFNPFQVVPPRALRTVKDLKRCNAIAHDAYTKGKSNLF